MELLVGTSVIIAVIANEPERESLVRLTAGATLVAPHSVHWEIGNAFSAMLRRKRITLAQALNAIEQYEKIPIRWLEPGLNGTIAIAEAANIYAYDAYLIQSALEQHIPLISLDQNLVTTAKQMGAQVIEVTP